MGDAAGPKQSRARCGRGRGDWVEAIEQRCERVRCTQTSIGGGFWPNGSTACRLALAAHADEGWADGCSTQLQAHKTRKDAVRALSDLDDNKGCCWKKQSSGVSRNFQRDEMR